MKKITSFFHRRPELKEIFLSLIVGGLAFGVDFAVLIGSVEVFGINYLVGNTLGFILGTLINYLLTVRFIFTTSRLKKRHHEFMLFTILGLIGLFLQNMLMWAGVELLAINYIVTKLFATVLVFFWNFYSRKYSLFVVK